MGGEEGRSWTAVDKAIDITGRERELVVIGAVRLPSTSHTARLQEKVPPSFNDRILLLDLIVEQHGVGGDVMTLREVRYDKRPIERGAYEQVEVLQDGARLALMNVQLIES